jgi:hypothetical protein
MGKETKDLLLDIVVCIAGILMVMFAMCVFGGCSFTY